MRGNTLCSTAGCEEPATRILDGLPYCADHPGECREFWNKDTGARWEFDSANAGGAYSANEDEFSRKSAFTAEQLEQMPGVVAVHPGTTVPLNKPLPDLSDEDTDDQKNPFSILDTRPGRGLAHYVAENRKLAARVEELEEDLAATRESHAKIAKAVRRFLGLTHWPKMYDKTLPEIIDTLLKRKAKESLKGKRRETPRRRKQV